MNPELCVYLGAPEPAWIGRTEVPLFVSYGRLRRLKKKLPRSPWRGHWALDSRGYFELKQHGRWTIDPITYFEDVLRYGREIGNLFWAVQQDWMTEDEILARTGLTPLDHVRLTAANYLVFEVLWGRVEQDRPDDVLWDGNPILPALQGKDLADYHLCWDLMTDPDRAVREIVRDVLGLGTPVAGINLMDMPVVGLGSICKRQATSEIGDIVTSLWERGHNGETGLPIHAFGCKTLGLERYGYLLESSDSQACFDHARHANLKYEGCQASHPVCSYCLTYGLAWRERLVAKLEGTVNAAA